jgi:hypothetical protein
MTQKIENRQGPVPLRMPGEPALARQIAKKKLWQRVRGYTTAAN